MNDNSRVLRLFCSSNINDCCYKGVEKALKHLRRNLETFYYCTVASTERTVNANGQLTGGEHIVYNEPVMAKGVISANQGTAQIEQFGNNLVYSKVISICDTSLPIDETTGLFIEKSPLFNDSGTPLYNYVVKAVAKTKNITSYAVDKVSIS